MTGQIVRGSGRSGGAARQRPFAHGVARLRRSLGPYAPAACELTGERPMEGSTPDSLLALHDAGYREVVARLGPGTRPRRRLRRRRRDRPPRRPRPLRHGHRLRPRHGPARSVAVGRRTAAGIAFAGMDGRRPRAPREQRSTGSARRTSSSTSPRPSATSPSSPGSSPTTAPRSSSRPNRPADFENPFHVYLFEADELASMLRLFFHDVEVLGLEGDEELQADFAARRRSGERILKLDVLNLRHRIPRRWYVWSVRARAPGRLQAARERRARRRLRHRPHAPLPHARHHHHDAGAVRDRPVAARA